MEQLGISERVHDKTRARCHHCKTPLESHKESFLDSAGKTFCCSGCRAVHGLLAEKGLLYYYTLCEKVGAQIRVPHPNGDDIYLTQKLNGAGSATLELEGIHCASCVWLLERLPIICPGVLSAEARLASGQLHVTWDPARTSLQTIAHSVTELGYHVKVSSDSNLSKVRNVARQRLIELGIAGAVAMNIMVLAVSLYQGEWSGIEKKYEALFRWASLALTIPAVGYCALPIYTRALAALRAGTLHIDIPIALGIILSFTLSLINTFRGSGEIYFDSLTTIIFLLLASRFAHQCAFETSKRAFSSSWSLFPAHIHVQTKEGIIEDAPLELLEAGTQVVVYAGERIPCDGIIERGSGSLDCSAITGESLPQPVGIGSAVLAGTLNVESTLYVRASSNAGTSQLDRILQSVSESASTPAQFITSFDTLSALFTIAALLLAFAAFVLHIGTGLEAATSAAIAMLTVTCPCAVALALPLLSIRTLSASSQAGILVKSPQVFEDLPNVRSLFFDKTGTLTEGRLTVAHAFFARDLNKELSQHAYDALSHLVQVDQHHPASRAIRHWMATQEIYKNVPSIRAGSAKRIPGRGVTANLYLPSGHTLTAVLCSRAYAESLQRYSSDSGQILEAKYSEQRSACDIVTESVLTLDGRCIAVFTLVDAVRPAAKAIVDALIPSATIQILSGDAQPACNAVATQLGIEPRNAHGGLLPEDKALIVSGAKAPTLFAGDGANDAPALLAATVSVALRGGIQSLLECANVFIVRGELEQLKTLRGISKRYRARSRMIIAAGLCYNVVGILAALLGYITPLIAAVAMPVFSTFLVVVAYTAHGQLACQR